jgi:hypothetical protein
VALWRNDDPEVFTATIAAAAEKLRVPPIAVEKDYWVCEVLRAIVRTHGDEVVFKGGTSLEKLRIIQRFSEDLDLLVVGEYRSTPDAKRAMKAMLASAVSTIGRECTDEKSGGRLGSLHRQAYLELPIEHDAEASGLADPTAVLIELGQSGGPKPSMDGSVNSLLSRALDGVIEGDWDDLRPFAVTILHPGRTLLEKLLRVNNFVVDPDRRDTTHGLPRIGRQFYDVWALLGESSVIELLADKAQVTAILQSIFEVSQQFSPDHPVPKGGFAASNAFALDSEFAAALRKQHDIAMRDLHYGEEPPTFVDVLDRVHSCAELLDPER